MPPQMNTNIALQTQLPAATRSPLQTLGALAALRENQQQAQERQLLIDKNREMLEDNDAITRTMAETHGDHDEAARRLYAVRPQAAWKIQDTIADIRTKQNNDVKVATENALSRLKMAAQIVQGVDSQQSFDMAIEGANPLVGELFPNGDIRSYVGRTYNPETIKSVLAAGTTRETELKRVLDAAEEDRKATEFLAKKVKDADEHAKAVLEANDHRRVAASLILSTAKSQQDLEAKIRMLSVSGKYPPDVLAPFGTRWYDGYGAAALKMGQTPNEQVQAANNAALRDQGNQNLELRRQELQQRKDEEAANPSGSRRATGPTPAGRTDAEARRAKAFEEIEKDIKEHRTDVKDKDGKPTGQYTWSIPPDAKKEYTARKIRASEAYRAEMGMRGYLDTELELAADPSKAKDLQRLRNEYKHVAGEEMPLQKMEGLAREIAKETDPAKKAALVEDLRVMREEYRQQGR